MKTLNATYARAKPRYERGPASARANWSAPVIAMTITLAGRLCADWLAGRSDRIPFREFAFTLASYAVFISGVVALTLRSPVMSAHLLSAGGEEHGLTGRINRESSIGSAAFMAGCWIAPFPRARSLHHLGRSGSVNGSHVPDGLEIQGTVPAEDSKASFSVSSKRRLTRRSIKPASTRTR